MKKLMMVLGAALLLPACSSEMKIVSADVPPTVLAAFNSKYPDAKDVEWEVEKESGHLVFEADFRQDGKRKEVQFKPDGTILNED